MLCFRGPSLWTSQLRSQMLGEFVVEQSFYIVGCSGEGNGNPLQYPCLENPMDRGAWRATVHGVVRVRHDWATSLLLLGCSTQSGRLKGAHRIRSFRIRLGPVDLSPSSPLCKEEVRWERPGGVIQLQALRAEITTLSGWEFLWSICNYVETLSLLVTISLSRALRGILPVLNGTTCHAFHDEVYEGSLQVIKVPIYFLHAVKLALMFIGKHLLEKSCFIEDFIRKKFYYIRERQEVHCVWN